MDFIPEEFRAEGLIKLFETIDMNGNRVLIPRAKVAREILPMKLRKMGARVDVIPVYETKMPGKAKIDQVRKLLLSGSIDIITFTSSSTATNFFSMIGKDRKIISRSTIACIGPITAETMRRFGIEPQIVSGTYTVQGLKEEIASYFTTRQPN